MQYSPGNFHCILISARIARGFADFSMQPSAARTRQSSPADLDVFPLSAYCLVFRPAQEVETKMARSVVTQLMFEGKAEEAMKCYVALFKGSQIGKVEKYGPGEMGPEGSIKRAEFTVAGHPLACIDSPVKHAFTFTPSISLFVECIDEQELDTAFQQLSAGGMVLMPPGNYGFSAKFAWINDRFGVSWQLNLTGSTHA